MDFLSNTEILLALLIVPAALALDWAIRNGNFFTPEHHDQEDGVFDSNLGESHRVLLDSNLIIDTTNAYSTNVKDISLETNDNWHGNTVGHNFYGGDDHLWDGHRFSEKAFHDDDYEGKDHLWDNSHSLSSLN